MTEFAPNYYTSLEVGRLMDPTDKDVFDTVTSFCEHVIANNSEVTWRTFLPKDAKSIDLIEKREKQITRDLISDLQK